MTFDTWLFQLFAICLGAIGFSLFNKIKVKHLAPSTLGGLLTWVIYTAMFSYTDHIFLATLVGGVFSGVWAEVMARVMKAPANVYIPGAIIPLLPGSALYSTMSALLDGNTELFSEHGTRTLLITFGLASGILLSSIIAHYILKFGAFFKRRYSMARALALKLRIQREKSKDISDEFDR